MPNFWRLPHEPNSQNSIISFGYDLCWFLGKNLFNFVYPTRKLNNLYCHSAQCQNCSIFSGAVCIGLEHWKIIDFLYLAIRTRLWLWGFLALLWQNQSLKSGCFCKWTKTSLMKMFRQVPSLALVSRKQNSLHRN